MPGNKWQQNSLMVSKAVQRVFEQWQPHNPITMEAVIVAVFNSFLVSKHAAELANHSHRHQCYRKMT